MGWSVSLVENLAENMGTNRCKTRGLYSGMVEGAAGIHCIVDVNTRVVQWFIHGEYTRCPQVRIKRSALRIESLPDFGDMFAYSEVKLDSFFDFFDRMNRGGVIFAT